MEPDEVDAAAHVSGSSEQPEMPRADGDVCADAAAPAVESVSYLGFVVGLDVYGLPLEHLREVARLKRLRRIPGAPSNVAGLMNLRGQIVCALDTRAILCVPGSAAAGGGYLIALRGFPDPLGLVVDGVTDVYAVDPGSIAPPPEAWPASRTVFTLGTVAIPRGSMTLLDLRPMIGRPA